jgi:hypothetical protein
MKPQLNERIAQFDSPFRRLDELLAPITPDPAKTADHHVVGEPQDSPPALLADTVARTRTCGTGIRTPSARPSSAARLEVTCIGGIPARMGGSIPTTKSRR